MEEDIKIKIKKKKQEKNMNMKKNPKIKMLSNKLIRTSNQKIIRCKTRIKALNYIEKIIRSHINTFYIVLSLILSISSNSDIEGSIVLYKINATGNIPIYGNQFNFPPDEIYINEVKQNDIQSYQICNKSENDIKLIWKSKVLSSINNLFSEYSKITEINLSNFKGSMSISNMFSGFSSLISASLSNFNAPSHMEIRNMFPGCYKISEINLFNFSASSHIIFQNLVSGCSSFISLNLNNIRSSSHIIFENLVSGCSLIQLNISKIGSSSYIQVNNIFSGNSSVYIYLENPDGKLFDKIVNGISEDITICSNDIRNFENFNGYNININCFNKNSYNSQFNCFKKNSIIQIDRNICVKCGNNFYPIYHNSNNISINCSESPEFYDSDLNELETQFQ